MTFGDWKWSHRWQFLCPFIHPILSIFSSPFGIISAAVSPRSPPPLIPLHLFNSPPPPTHLHLLIAHSVSSFIPLSPFCPSHPSSSGGLCTRLSAFLHSFIVSGSETQLPPLFFHAWCIILTRMPFLQLSFITVLPAFLANSPPTVALKFSPYLNLSWQYVYCPVHEVLLFSQKFHLDHFPLGILYGTFLYFTLYWAEALILMLHSLPPSFMRTTVAAHLSKHFLSSFKLKWRDLESATLMFLLSCNECKYFQL